MSSGRPRQATTAQSAQSKQQQQYFITYFKRDYPDLYDAALQDFGWYFRLAIRNAEKSPNGFNLWLYSVHYNLHQHLYNMLRYMEDRNMQFPATLDDFLALYERVYADWKRQTIHVESNDMISPTSDIAITKPIALNGPLRDPLSFPANSALYRSKAAVSSAISLIKTHVDKAKILKRRDQNTIYTLRRTVEKLANLLFLQKEFVKAYNNGADE
nr:MAG: hypothetical protein [Apis mellifra filamentous-like virus]